MFSWFRGHYWVAAGAGTVQFFRFLSDLKITPLRSDFPLGWEED